MGARRKFSKRERGRWSGKWERISPFLADQGVCGGSVVSSLNRVSGGATAENEFGAFLASRNNSCGTMTPLKS